MRAGIVIRIALIVGLSLLLYGTATASDNAAKSKGKSASSPQVARGEYLLTLGGCNDCHTPKRFTDKGPVLDGDLLLSGHPASENVPAVPKDTIGPGKWSGLFNGGLTAWAGPWGVSFAGNLTPDRETGIGAWTEKVFATSLRTGRTPGGRPLLPPMPWEFFRQMTDRDFKALHAYLRSVKPVRNMVPTPIPPQ